jgi:2-polyprenyl-3-methyl-5-hydroxy-6-metoxy-1,4-benzoquinol methylase
MQNTLERINPDELTGSEITGRETLELHMERYHYAGRYLVPGTLADIACGTGYGSYLLATEYSKNLSRIIAVDIDAGSIDFARSRYAHSLIQYEVAEATRFEPSGTLNNIVSLETIEHLSDPELFIRHVSAHLSKGGRFITSVPITPSMDANPYHLHDFTVASFRKMFTGNGFKEIHSLKQIQPYNPLTVLSKKESRGKDLRDGVLLYYIHHPGKFLLRLYSLINDGFSNKYLVAVFEKL